MVDKLLFLVTENMSAIDNMALDTLCLEQQIPIFRIYTWKNPTVSLGKHQKCNNLNTSFCEEHTIDIIKRPTGGRAFLHQGDFSYSLVLPLSFFPDSSVQATYHHISQVIIDALECLTDKEINISGKNQRYFHKNACMATKTTSDLEIEGHKIAGSAQLRSRDWLLQHGSILIDQDFNLLNHIFGMDTQSIKVKNLKDYLKESFSIPTLVISIKNSLRKWLAIDNIIDIHISRVEEITTKILTES